VTDLAATTYALAMRWWDPGEHMVWNPPGSFDEAAAPGTLHLVPPTAWLAYAQLAQGDEAAWSEGVAAIAKLISLQYDEPGTVFHGTYRRFLEQPPPPAEPVMWEHYDPNWRQFVGTTFAIILADFGARLDPRLVTAIEQSIRLACLGEPDGRIPPGYANPALMRAWLDAWCGSRLDDAALVERGRSFARAVVAEFDAYSAFDEFNSPTYYGIDLYALRLWRCLPPDDFFAEHGARLETAIWRSAGAFFNANLKNFCGPFTRSYNPDATRGVALLSLWIWALLGRECAPLPRLDVERIEHSHDLMAGPLFARLAGAPDGVDLSEFRSFTHERTVAQQLAGGRTVTAWIGRELMIGAEASDIDWGGWDQFMPATAHWGSADGAGTLWLLDAHIVAARAERSALVLTVADDVRELRFGLFSTTPPSIVEGVLRAGDADVGFGDGFARASVARVGEERYEVTAVRMPARSTDDVSARLTFELRPRPRRTS
jgi:hypothetical protein